MNFFLIVWMEDDPQKLDGYCKLWKFSFIRDRLTDMRIHHSLHDQDDIEKILKMLDKFTVDDIIKYQFRWSEVRVVNNYHRYFINSFNIFQIACDNNVFPIVRKCIEKGINPNFVTVANQTAICMSIRHGNFEMTRFLLENKTDPFFTDTRRGNSYLHYQYVLSNTKWMQLFLDHGVDINFQNKGGSTPLMRILKRNVIPPDSYLFLLENDSDIRICNKKGISGLHMLFRFGNLHMFKSWAKKEGFRIQ